MGSVVHEGAGLLVAALGLAIVGVASPFGATGAFDLLRAAGFSLFGIVVLIAGLWILARSDSV